MWECVFITFMTTVTLFDLSLCLVAFFTDFRLHRLPPQGEQFEREVCILFFSLNKIDFGFSVALTWIASETLKESHITFSLKEPSGTYIYFNLYLFGVISLLDYLSFARTP